MEQQHPLVTAMRAQVRLPWAFFRCRARCYMHAEKWPHCSATGRHSLSPSLPSVAHVVPVLPPHVPQGAVGVGKPDVVDKDRPRLYEWMHIVQVGARQPVTGAPEMSWVWEPKRHHLWGYFLLQHTRPAPHIL